MSNDTWFVYIQLKTTETFITSEHYCLSGFRAMNLTRSQIHFKVNIWHHPLLWQGVHHPYQPPFQCIPFISSHMYTKSWSSQSFYLDSFPFNLILLISLPPAPGQSSSWGTGGLVPLESRNLSQFCVGAPSSLDLSSLWGVHPHQGELHA